MEYVEKVTLKPKYLEYNQTTITKFSTYLEVQIKARSC